MNDEIPDPQPKSRVVGRFLQLYFADEESADTGPDTKADASETPADDPAVFEEQEFRDSMGDTGLMRQLIDVFDEETGQCLEGARGAVSAGDAEALHVSSHALKGLLGNYSAPSALSAAADLDDLARRGEMDGAGDSLAACEREVGRLREALEAFRTTLPSE